MAKYILCILLGVFLSWGFTMISNEEQRVRQSEIGCTIQQAEKEKALIKQQEYAGKQNYNNKGILKSFSYRHFSPSKILRFNISSVTIRILSSLKHQLPRNQWAGFSYYINFTKYSDKYHIYAIKRILI